jgi:hypothetical protein
LLERADLLDAWFGYEREAVTSALRDWCEENDFVAVCAAGQLPG